MSTRYTPLDDKSDVDSGRPSDDCESLLPTSQPGQHHHASSAKPGCRHQKHSPLTRILLFSVGTFVASLALVSLGVFIGSRGRLSLATGEAASEAEADKICPEHVQHYSPILSEVDTSLHLTKFNGSFMHENSFRKEAGPEVDAAWASIGVHYRAMAIPAEEALKSGFRADQVHISEKYGGGYPANVEGLHHLHCLNLVRQSLYFNYNYYHSKGEGAFVNEDRIVKFHVTHCLDIIRQQLMCQPDTGLLGQVWWDKTAPTAFVDFNTDHKCKNFEAIRQWAEERQMPEEVPIDYLQPPAEGDLIYDEIP